MDVHSKILDAHVTNLSAVALHDSLRQLEVLRRHGGELDAHESAFARAYRVKRADGSSACLRFWKNVPPERSFLTLYSALEQAHEMCTRLSLPNVALISEAITVKETRIPAVVMDWVEGSPLGDYVDRNLSTPANLSSTAEALRRLFNAHNATRTSHGDLRASNILARFDANSVQVGLIDLDSIRWNGGPELPRVVGGNVAWDELRKRHHVSALEYDYLDQAMTYLAVVAVAQNVSLWPGSTDDFLTVDYLRGDSDATLRDLEKLSGAPARVASAVRRVVQSQGLWSELSEAMVGSSSETLHPDEFWRRAFVRGSTTTPAPHRLQPTPPTPPTPRRKPAMPPPPRKSTIQTVSAPARHHPQAPARARLIGLWIWVLIAVLLFVVVVVYLLWRTPLGNALTATSVLSHFFKLRPPWL